MRAILGKPGVPGATAATGTKTSVVRPKLPVSVAFVQPKFWNIFRSMTTAPGDDEVPPDSRSISLPRFTITPLRFAVSGVAVVAPIVPGGVAATGVKSLNVTEI